MADKEKYLSELESYLSPLTSEEADDAIDFYSEYMEDAGLQTKEKIERKLGTAKQLSRKILADHSIKVDEDNRQNNRKSSPRFNSKMIWIIILAILSAPMTLGIGGILLLLIVCAIFTISIVAVVGLATLIVIVATSIYTGVLLLFTHWTVGVFYLGCGIVALGGLMIALPLLYWICSVIIQMVANFARYLYRRFSKRRQRRSEQ
ncbi:HAAS signaling domain-containing protein [Liquorilactobacillus uvarum]|nr:DUF1700 domain-containing protein [Liquorilactobacillus uvarum]